MLWDVYLSRELDVFSILRKLNEKLKMYCISTPRSLCGQRAERARAKEGNKQTTHLEKGTDDPPAVQPKGPEHSRRRELFHAQHARLSSCETVELPRNIQDSAMMGDAGIDTMTSRKTRHKRTTVVV